MRVRHFLLVTVAASAVVLTGGAGTDLPILAMHEAQAGNGNGNGNGNDEDRGRGNDEDRENGPDKDRGNKHDDEDGGRGRSEEAHGNGGGNGGGNNGNNEETTSLAAADPGLNPAQGNHGGLGLDARVAGLHAVNANINAFIHANENSRVGEIAVYAMAVVGGEVAEAAVVAAQDALDDAALALIDANDLHAANVGILTDQYGYADTSPEALEQAKADLLLIDPAQLPSDAEREAYFAELAAVDAALASGAAAADAQIAVNDANEDLLAAQQAAAEAEALAVAALEEAANANRLPVDDDVRLYVDTQLEEGGVLDYYRGQLPPAGP